QVRLAGGPGECAGRVEVLHSGTWGTVCDDTWDFAAAAVVCRSLGCGQVISAPPHARFGEGRGPIWLDGLTCKGHEGHLGECHHKGWGVHGCEHSEDAGVVCAGEPGELRLADGPHRCSGRVEVLHNHTWGTICGHTWGLAAAQVVCRHLGCGHALSTPGAAHFGAGPGPVWLDGLRCVGNETNITQCPGNTWGPHTCEHLDRAGVVCSGNSSSGEVRLVDGPHLCMGRVEVLHDGQWGTVCDDNWDLREAQVVCRQVGCGEAQAAHGHAHFGRGVGPIWLDDVTCVGDETHLGQCHARPWGRNNCHHGEDAGVVCSGGSGGDQPQVRLVGGPGPCAGRVEVLHEHRWGTVCDDSWDLRDARVTCRQVGCGAAVAAPGHAYFGEGAGPILLDQVGCTGEEDTLAECELGAWGVHNCNHEEDAGVVCAGEG
ncbi:DMBT1 protein, partial [Pachyramphus minor]|nr:DMBT1 protein [Pachyramphus minor]